MTISIRGLLGLAALAGAVGGLPHLAHGQADAVQPAEQSVPARANLNITPKRLIFDRGRRTASVYVFNQGNVPVTADVSIVDRVMLPDGQIRAVEDVASQPDLKPIADRLNSARAFVMAAPRRITLMPGRGQTIRLRAVLPPDAQAAEYRSHFTVVAVPPRTAGLTAENAAARAAGQLSIQINAVFGLSIPVILRNGPAEARAAIRNARVERGEDGAVATFDLVRTGANSLYGTIEALDSRGERIGIARGVGVYPEIDARHIRLRLTRTPAPGEVLDIRFVDDDVEPGHIHSTSPAS